MKNLKINRIIIIFLLLGVATGMANAQEWRLNGFASYVFQDNVEGYNNMGVYQQGTISDGLQYGGGLEYLVNPTKGIELKYLRQDAKFSSNSFQKDKDLAVNYILLGGNNYFKVSNEKIEPYAGGGIGMAILNLQTSSGNEDATKFAWNLKLGTNIWLSEKVGLKLQAEMLSAVQSVGGGLYFGTGGTGAGVSTYSSMLQFSLGGGLTFKLGK